MTRSWYCLSLPPPPPSTSTEGPCPQHLCTQSSRPSASPSRPPSRHSPFAIQSTMRHRIEPTDDGTLSTTTPTRARRRQFGQLNEQAGLSVILGGGAFGSCGGDGVGVALTTASWRRQASPAGSRPPCLTDQQPGIRTEYTMPMNIG
jgi:hypothetical protein